MTATKQDFTTYAGDACQPNFLVTNEASAPIDLSGVTEIKWTIQRDQESLAVLTKLKTTGGVVLISGGVGGQFYVDLTGADTAPLSSYYMQTAVITDAYGNVSTVTLGRMRVGQQPSSSYSGDPARTSRDYVRSLIGDTDPNSALYTDLEIDNFITQFGSPLWAAGAACRSLAARYAGKTSRRVGDLSINYGELTKNYLAMADQFDAKAAIEGVGPYAGGTSVSDMVTQNQDTDQVRAPFATDQFDNPLADQGLPVSPIGGGG